MRTRCETCPNRTAPIVPGRGEPGGVVIVGQAPGHTEARQGRIFTGMSGRLLEATVRQIDLGPVYYTNAVACAWEDTPTDEAVAACRQSLHDELKSARVEKVLTMGNAAIQSLLPGSKPITMLRPNRLYSKELDCPVVPTLNAAAALHDPDVFRDITVDMEILQSLPRDYDKWERYVKAPQYTLIETPRQFTRMLNEIDTSHHISLDIETTGFNPVEDEIICIGIGDGTHVWILSIEDGLMNSLYVRQNLQRFLEDEALSFVGQNWYQFDWKFIWQKYRIDSRCDFDPMLAHYTLDERQVGHNLKALVRQYLGYPDYSVDIRGRYENYGDIPRLELWQYLAWDVQGAWELVEPLHAAMLEDDPDLIDVHDKILLPGSKALGIMELNGVCVDVDYYKKLSVELEERMKDIQAKLQKITDELEVTNLQGAINEELATRERHEWALEAQKRGEISGRERIQIRAKHTAARNALTTHEFNPRSYPQVKLLVWDALRLTRDTTKEGLEAVESRHPAPKLINEYRQLGSLKGKDVDGLINRRWKSDGKVHGNFLPIGTRTGRLSGQDPNWQNVPILVGPIVRRGVVASPGWTLAECDNSQVELRIAGVFSRDERLIAVYRDGRDIHREVAVTMYHRPAEEITSRERYNAKYVDFPILFGATAESLVGTGDPPWDLPTAKGFVDGFLNGFPDLAAWMDYQRRTVKEQGYVKTLFGRKRRYPLILDHLLGDIERQAINSPIQGSASDLCFTALARVCLELHERRKRGEPEECRVLLTVHDSILIEAVSHKIHDYVRWVLSEMEKTPSEWDDLGLPFKAEAKIGDNWGDMKEWNPNASQVLALATS